jgi:hypothetical protein
VKVYLAGPMRGYPEFNFPAFFEAEKKLQTLGFDVINPARLDVELGFDPKRSLEEQPNFPMDDFIKRDLACILSLPKGKSLLVLLPGFSSSVGVTAEIALAKWRGVPQFTLAKVLDKSEWWSAKNRKEAGIALPSYVITAKSPSDSGEVRIISPTGGQKGQKLERFELLPPMAMEEVAQVYGKGAEKYAPRNWEKGYSWNLSLGALERHLNKFKAREQRDELGNHHLACVVFHCLALMTFEKYNLGTDDRSTLTKTGSTEGISGAIDLL